MYIHKTIILNNIKYINHRFYHKFSEILHTLYIVSYSTRTERRVAALMEKPPWEFGRADAHSQYRCSVELLGRRSYLPL